MRWLGRTVGVLGATVLVGGLLAAPAQAQAAAVPLSYHAAATVTVHGDGRRVAVGYTYRCPKKYGGSLGYAIVTLTLTEQLASGHVAQGTSGGGPGAYLVCDGAWHQGSQTVYASGRRFAAGRTATLRSDLLACPASEVGCLMPTKHRSVEVV